MLGTAAAAGVPLLATGPTALVADEPRRVRVLVAVQESVFCSGLNSLIERHAGLRLIGYTCDGAQLLQLCRELRPDVLLLEPALTGVRTVEMLGELGDTRPRTVLLARSLSELQPGGLSLGIRGVVLRTARPERVVEAVRAVAAGERWIGREVIASLIDRALRRLAYYRGGGAVSVQGLTRGERYRVSALLTAAAKNATAERQQRL